METAGVGEQAAEAKRFSGSLAPPSPELAGSQSSALVVHAQPPVKRFVRQQVPDEIVNNQSLNQQIKALPSNYNFEIHKTIWRIQQAGAKTVALQFPEGLLMYACVIADILQQYAGVEHALIMGDVTYGACCIDDFSAKAAGAEMLVHYGHSCLVPVDVTSIPCLYIFVDISLDLEHLVDTIKLNFSAGTKIALAGTIQFSSAIQMARQQLAGSFPSLAVPKCKPLSPGEVLGCTAPVLPPASAEVIVFVADGRFHLEAIMIANPELPAYRYDPYGRQLIKETYDHKGMRTARRKAVEAACAAQRWGLILGTLGRQGNPAILDTVQGHLRQKGLPSVTMLMSEVLPTRLKAMENEFDVFVQVACPRLSIDWGEGFSKPTLTPYEALVALGVIEPWWIESADASTDTIDPYPMDYYAQEGGVWNSSYHKSARAPAG